MLRYRLTFGLLMLALLLGMVWLDSRLDTVDIAGTFWQRVFLGRTYLPAGLVMLAVFCLMLSIGARELAAIYRAKGMEVDTVMVLLASSVGWLIAYIMPSGVDSQLAMAVFATLVVGLFLATLVRYSWLAHRTQGAVAVAGATMLTLIYVGILPSFYILIRRWHSAWLVFVILLIVKLCDIGAFTTGKLIGRRKMIPWLSPNKTWEGLIGGVVFSSVGAVLLGLLGNHLQATGGWSVHLVGHWVRDGVGWRHYVPAHYSLWALAIFGALSAVVGQFGDLVASLFKRDAGIKDSGKTVPGFGGMIDVVDSPLVVAPLAYWMVVVLDALGR
jgi:phosphatidate cytidylyltransferase